MRYWDGRDLDVGGYREKPDLGASFHTLIFSFHGHGDDMENFQYVGLQQAWPDAIVVYFQGLPSRDGHDGQGRMQRASRAAARGLRRCGVWDRRG